MRDYDLDEHVCEISRRAAKFMMKKMNVLNAESCLVAVGNSARDGCSHLCTRHITWAVHQVCMTRTKREVIVIIVRRAFICTLKKQTHRTITLSCIMMVCNN